MSEKGFLEVLCRRFLERDPDVVEIVLFGSSVYAPDLSRDVDLPVVSRRLRISISTWT